MPSPRDCAVCGKSQQMPGAKCPRCGNTVQRAACALGDKERSGA